MGAIFVAPFFRPDTKIVPPAGGSSTSHLPTQLQIEQAWKERKSRVYTINETNKYKFYKEAYQYGLITRNELRRAIDQYRVY